MAVANNESLGDCVVVWCPQGERTGLPHYDRGTVMQWSDFGNSTYNSTLDDGYWPLGMVVEYRGKLYVVCGDGRFWLEQKKQGYPYGVEYPPEKLRMLNGKHYTRKVFSHRPDGSYVRYAT